MLWLGRSTTLHSNPSASPGSRCRDLGSFCKLLLGQEYVAETAAAGSADRLAAKFEIDDATSIVDKESRHAVARRDRVHERSANRGAHAVVHLAARVIEVEVVCDAEQGISEHVPVFDSVVRA